MALSPRTRLGLHEVLSVLDADGIGAQVYHARDARVDGRCLAVMHDA